MNRRIGLAAALVVLASGASAHAQAPYLVKDFGPAPAPTGLEPGVGAMLGAVGDRAFFTSLTPEHGLEVWTSLGTPESTVAVELTPGTESSTNDPVGPIATIGGSILFWSVRGPWRTDGTVQGTERLDDDPYWISLPGVANGALALFVGNDGLYQPLRSDGTREGTFRLTTTDQPVSMTIFFQPTAFGSGFAFLGGNANGTRELWRSDGSVGGTKPVPSFKGRQCSASVAVDEQLAIACSQGNEMPADLFWTDGTGAGTRLVAHLPNGGSGSMVNAEGRIFFLAVDGGGQYSEPWTSDGTAAGTYRLADVAPGSVDLRTSYLVASGNVVYFVATTVDTGRELWRSDGTAAGTFMLRDIQPGGGDGFPVESDPNLADRYVMLPVPGGLVFSAFSSATGREAWITDGTTAGTRLLGETLPGPGSVSPCYFQRAGRRVFFRTTTPNHQDSDLWAIELPADVVSVGDVTVTEGDASSIATFTVRLTAPATQAVVVSYATANGTAVAGLDFAAASGTLTFAPGVKERTVDVAIVGDVRDEADESFTLVLSAPNGASIGDGRGVAVVLDDDAPTARLSGPVVVTEGNSGTTDAVFTVVLTTGDGGPTAQEATVGFATENGTAQGAEIPFGDYVITRGVVTFPPGTASGATAVVRVPVVGDTFDESDEYFELTLQTYGGNVVADGQPGRGTIRDDDGRASDAPFELSHGSDLRATVAAEPGGAADQDYYIARTHDGSSYEVIVDEVSGDAQPLQLLRLASSGPGQAATVNGTGNSLSLRWWQGFWPSNSVFPTLQLLRVANAACGSSCGADDTYRLRFYETTLTTPRFNNRGTQRSTVILHNPSSAPVTGRQQYWDEKGVPIANLPFSIQPHGTLIVDTAAAMPQRSGSMSFVHDAPYGVLTGKVATVDPATGLSTDTPIASKPR